MEIIRATITFFNDYGGLFALLLTWAGIGWVYVRRRADWSRKEFLAQVNFSLSYVLEGGWSCARSLRPPRMKSGSVSTE